MPANDEHLTPQVRREQLAELLARGVLRWHEPRLRSSDPETSPACLEVPAADRLSVPSGERSREARPADVDPDSGDE